MRRDWTSAWITALEGKTVVGVDVSEREEAMRFRCADGTSVVWGTYGDCCSESWWADAFSLNQLRGAAVTSVREIELPPPDDDRGRQEIDQAYGVQILTDKGMATLAFRNSSNGYYGGDVCLGSDDDDREWREIPDNDWQAT